MGGSIGVCGGRSAKCEVRVLSVRAKEDAGLFLRRSMRMDN